MEPRTGLETCHQNGLVVDYFLGKTWLSASAGTLDAIQALIAGCKPDPADLRQVNRDLAPLLLPDCGLNYCQQDWHADRLFDENLYDCIIGTCPRGHEYMVDD